MRNTMTHHEMVQLLDSVMYYVTPEIRRKVMREVPAAYNAWCGRPVVATVPVEDLPAKPACDACGGPMHVPTWGCVRPRSE